MIELDSSITENNGLDLSEKKNRFDTRMRQSIVTNAISSISAFQQSTRNPNSCSIREIYSSFEGNTDNKNEPQGFIGKHRNL